MALEKLTFLLKSSPDANVEILAKEVSSQVAKVCKQYNITVHEQAYHSSCLENKNLLIAATADKELNRQIADDAKTINILVNVADTPELCDFYLGSIVNKGNVKIAISTNGTSPTLAKRLRQFLETVLPDDITDLANKLGEFREQLKGDFQTKVKRLNELTEGLLSENKAQL